MRNSTIEETCTELKNNDLLWLILMTEKNMKLDITPDDLFEDDDYYEKVK